MQGWIKVERKIQTHWIWSKDKPFDIRSAWLEMLLLANHKDNKFPLGSEMIFVPRGSFITSERKLGERWQWSNTKVRSFLKLLESDGMIVKKTDSKKSTITIVNYSVYQNSESTKTSQEKRTESKGTSQEHTNKNDIKKDNKYIDHFDTFWNTYPKKVGKAAAQKSFIKIRVDDKLLQTMLGAIEIQRQSNQWSNKQFIPNPATWLNQRRWEDEIENINSTDGITITADGTFKI